MTVNHLSRLVIRVLLVGYAAIILTACSDTSERGPYLQNPSSTTMVVRWRATGESTATVRYGASPKALNNLAESNSDLARGKFFAYDHEVLLVNLVPETRYYYRVSGLADDVYSFKTPPVEGVARPVRVWILGDPGTAYDTAIAVREKFYEFNQGSAIDLTILLGDIAYQEGTDAQFQTALFEMYPATLSSTPFYSTIGNHDTKTDEGAPYYENLSLPVDGKTGTLASGTEAYYSFNYSNIHFVCLDSELSDTSPNGAMYNWLKADLAANKQDWTVVYTHRPPYSFGRHNSDKSSNAMNNLREHFTLLFEQYGVDLMFAGHNHNYERSYPIKGHQGTSDTFVDSMKSDPGNGRKNGDGKYLKAYDDNSYGVIYSVVGSSGKVRSAALGHPAHYVSMLEAGSVVLDFNGDTLDVTFVSPNPEAIDYYTIEKQ